MVAEDASTKVYYHLDDSTPYMSVLPVPADSITLGDFKKVFTRRGYTYFCKEFDSALNVEVKVEIASDSEKLHKSANGHIELFLLSQSGTQGSAHFGAIPSSGTLPRTKGRPTSSTTVGFPAPSFKLSKRRSSALALSSIVDDMDVCGGQRVSMVTNERSMSGEASSDINTFISKRAGEHLAELYTSTSEDPYKFDVNSAPSFASSNNYRPLLNSTNYTIREDDDDDGGSSTVLQHSKNKFHLNMDQNFRQRKPRKQRYRKPYVPSTISSASESSLSASLPHVDEVQIRMQDGLPLGISVACHDGGVFISKILPGSAAEKCGRLEIGDQIVQVQDVSFETLSDDKCVDQLYRASRMKGTIIIYVAKRPRISDQKSDALSLLCETMQMDVSLWVEQTTKQDQLEPVEPFEELIHGELTSGKNDAILGINNSIKIPSNSRKIAQNFAFPSTSNGYSDQGDGAMTSDEERAAYADRRNGVGPMLVPALHQSKKHAAAVAAAQVQNTEILHHQEHNLQQKHQQQRLKKQQPQQQRATRAVNCVAGGSSTHSQEEDAVINFRNRTAAERLKNDENNDPLNIGMDPITILKRMAKPDSGLIIKDRKWLKIPVPNSFIGDEMVNWLLENVTGFRDRKAAKAYASILLSNGYIKHVVNMMNFNEKCYYIFEDSIISERLRLLQQPASQSTLASSTNTASTRVGGNSGGTESTTEITYMSSPSSPFLMMNKNNNLNKLNNNMNVVGAKTNNNANTLQLPPAVAAACQPSSVSIPGIVKVANNPRYVSPPTHIIRNELAMRMTDANNNNIKLSNGKMTAANDPNLGSGRGALNTTWPISPIPMFSSNLNNINNNLRDCNSPAVTNDYASMIQGEINGGAQFDTLDVIALRPKENNPPGQLPPLPPPISNIHNNNNNNNISANSSLQKSLPSQQNLF